MSTFNHTGNYICICGKEFINSQSFNGHKANCAKYLISVGRIKDEHDLAQFKINQGKTTAEKRKQNLKAKQSEQQFIWVNEQHKCDTCGKVMLEKYGSGRFCSRACANKFSSSKADHHNININPESRKIGQLRQQQAKINYSNNPKLCRICNKPIPYENRFLQVCSSECSTVLRHQHSLKAVSANQKRSKNEIYFYELCKQHFNVVKHNEPMFNGWDADVIIEDIKYAILWNGPWHYRKITESHSVEQVQNRDKIKINEIEQAGYTPYIIKDDGSYNPEFVEQQFKLLLKLLN